MMTTETEQQHDGFQALRRAGKYWENHGKEMLAGADVLEALLPDFVRRRYTISHFYRSTNKDYGCLDLLPVDGGTEDVAVANALHVDVNKLFDWLRNKRTAPDTTEGAAPHREPAKPKRSVGSQGAINYEFMIDDIAEFPDGLKVEFTGLGSGSACHITKKVTGTHEVEDVEYEMVCDDDPVPEPDPVPPEDAKEVVEATQ